LDRGPPGPNDHAQHVSHPGSRRGHGECEPGTLTNDFFVNLIDMVTEWFPVGNCEGIYEGRDRVSGDVRWTGTRADLICGSHSQMRALAEVYASSDAKE
jgi:catalase-peroxidase